MSPSAVSAIDLFCGTVRVATFQEQPDNGAVSGGVQGDLLAAVYDDYATDYAGRRVQRVLRRFVLECVEFDHVGRWPLPVRNWVTDREEMVAAADQMLVQSLAIALCIWQAVPLSMDYFRRATLAEVYNGTAYPAIAIVPDVAFCWYADRCLGSSSTNVFTFKLQSVTVETRYSDMTLSWQDIVSSWWPETAHCTSDTADSVVLHLNCQLPARSTRSIIARDRWHCSTSRAVTQTFGLCHLKRLERQMTGSASSIVVGTW